MTMLLGACAKPRTHYYWGNYSEFSKKYYTRYDRDLYIRDLLSIINKRFKRKVIPPGLYAEYGYLLLQSGDITQARVYFNLEKKHWPESTPLMDSLINETD